jgi:hypothetical protein
MSESGEDQDRNDQRLQELSSEFFTRLTLEAPQVLSLPSEQTMRHRRSVILLSLTILIVLATDTVPAKIEPLGIEFHEGQKPYFVFAAAAAMLYQLVMYVVHWNRDEALSAIQLDVLLFSFSTRVFNLSGLWPGSSAPPELPDTWQTEATELANRLKASITSWHRKLHIRLLRYVPALLVATAIVALATEYLPRFWSIVLGVLVMLGQGVSRLIARRDAQLAARQSTPTDAHSTSDPGGPA